MARDDRSDDGKVGYGCPPLHTRFQKGTSGNPNGRPRGSRNKPRNMLGTFEVILAKELSRDVSVPAGDRHAVITMLEAIIRSTIVKAAKGDHRSARLILEAKRRIDERAQAGFDVLVEEKIKYKFRGEDEIERRKALGLPEPEMFPHPDDIIYDPETGAVHIWGPETRELGPTWQQGDALIRAEAEAEARARELMVEIAAARKAGVRTKLLEEQADVTAMLSGLRRLFRDFPKGFKEHRLRRMREVNA